MGEVSKFPPAGMAWFDLPDMLSKLGGVGVDPYLVALPSEFACMGRSAEERVESLQRCAEPGQVRVYRLRSGAPCVLGRRREGSDVVLFEPTVSKVHAYFRLAGTEGSTGASRRTRGCSSATDRSSQLSASGSRSNQWPITRVAAARAL